MNYERLPRPSLDEAAQLVDSTVAAFQADETLAEAVRIASSHDAEEAARRRNYAITSGREERMTQWQMTFERWGDAASQVEPEVGPVFYKAVQAIAEGWELFAVTEDERGAFIWLRRPCEAVEPAKVPDDS